MDMNSLIHRRSDGGAAAPAIDGFRAPATGVSPFQNSALPGLRAHLPSLPIRFPALHTAGVSSTASAATAASSSAASASPPGASAAVTTSSATSASTSASSVSSSQQATSLAPLRFIIPSSHCPPSSSFAANVATENAHGRLSMPHSQEQAAAAAGVPRSYSDPALLSHGHPAMHHNRPPSIETHGGSFHDLDGALSTDGSDSKNKKSPGKRNRAVKNPNRSTKSKARPGLRKGKWTEEEERYATQLTNYFKEGLLPIERGTMLRLYLSQKLNCEPMRITKKFTGGECIGKQVFRPCSPTPESRIRLMQAQLELVALEAAFIKKLKENKEEVPGLTDDVDGTLAPGAIAVSARPKKRRPYQRESKNSEGDERDETGFTSDSSTSSDTTATASQRSTEGKKKGDVDDASAVGLLLDFFYKASKNENEDEKPSAADPAPMKRDVSTASSEPEPEHEEEYKSVVKEELVASPTKRMRTLSISQCHTDIISPKRSRVGSFTLMASNP